MGQEGLSAIVLLVLARDAQLSLCTYP